MEVLIKLVENHFTTVLNITDKEKATCKDEVQILIDVIKKHLSEKNQKLIPIVVATYDLWASSSSNGNSKVLLRMLERIRNTYRVTDTEYLIAAYTHSVVRAILEVCCDIPMATDDNKINIPKPIENVDRRKLLETIKTVPKLYELFRKEMYSIRTKELSLHNSVLTNTKYRRYQLWDNNLIRIILSYSVW